MITYRMGGNSTEICLFGRDVQGRLKEFRIGLAQAISLLQTLGTSIRLALSDFTDMSYSDICEITKKIAAGEEDFPSIV